MRFLADESCDFSVVRALREKGHDVLAVAEISPRAEDPDVIELAVLQDRRLLTEDKGFRAARVRPPSAVWGRSPTALPNTGTERRA